MGHRPALGARALRGWEHFWFQEIPLDVYALLRMAFGAVGLISLSGLMPVSAFWVPGSLIPLPDGGLGVQAFLFEHGFGQVAGVGLFLFLGACFTCMLIGFRSQWAVVGAFLGTLAQSFWNSLPLAGGNEVLSVLLFYLIWADTSGSPSLDAWLARRRANGDVPDPATESIWPLRLIRMQVAYIYLNTGLWKLLGDAWRDGSTIHYVLGLNGFQRFPIDVPQALQWILTLGTYLTLAWEIGFAVMVLLPWTRTLAIVMGIGVHLGLWFTLELGPFSPIMLASYIAFANPLRVPDFMSRIRTRMLRHIRPQRRDQRREPRTDVVDPSTV